MKVEAAEIFLEGRSFGKQISMAEASRVSSHPLFQSHGAIPATSP